MISHSDVRWGGLWRSVNKLDGRSEHLLYANYVPVLFRTRREAREYIKKKYGYILDAPDLRQEPHGWRLPMPVKVRIQLETT